ncbi:helix-turn-helix domain-containing protein [Pleomorphomonas carboxyditropha]|uniref:Transcriptional regulator n=1 Tax=Pleomorphomonas carboxyditropha TaxID=2023338 RepID=A0A2G9WS62_9HYPH|nr:helix-turn-helix transcriptional regulator [Pleomorphomonas carboxyditropha]PIO97548.1 transcriptional regulator [Pleomorphomonas carboxyditropha]
MNAQYLTTPSGERMVVIPEAEYERLVATAEDAADRAVVADFRRRLAVGEEELVSDEIVGRLLAGDNPVRVWREHRGLSVSALAAKAGIGQPYLSEIEAGKKEGGIGTMKKLAAALGVAIDDLV